MARCSICSAHPTRSMMNSDILYQHIQSDELISVSPGMLNFCIDSSLMDIVFVITGIFDLGSAFLVVVDRCLAAPWNSHLSLEEHPSRSEITLASAQNPNLDSPARARAEKVS